MGGVVVTAAAVTSTTDFGGNRGDGNGGPDCVFGAKECRI